MTTTTATTNTTDEPYLTVTWTDEVTGTHGYLVIDRLVRGVASGGLRMRAGCTLEEVRGLAAGMTRKEALNYDPGARYVPLGGAKGGIDCNPRAPGARDVLLRYVLAMRPYLERCWTAGEDLGLTQSLLDSVVAESGMESSIQAVYPLLAERDTAVARLAAAFAVAVDGVALDGLVGGYGVAVAALTALEEAGLPRRGTRAFVQGFGSMGGATARYLARAGLDVVGVADADGVIVNPGGLDVERLLAGRDALGAIDRSSLGPDDTQLPLDDWLGTDAEVLVPAATSYCIDAGNHAQVRARMIVEAANMPVTGDAERELAARGVTVVPDVVANSATNSWWWWTLFGDIDPTAAASFTKIDASMAHLVRRVLDRAEADGRTPRSAALDLADEQLAEITARFGVHRKR